MKFLGYKRADGKVGVRNKIFILPTSVCASDTTRIIASQIESAVTFNNQNGCSQVAGDQQLTMDGIYDMMTASSGTAIHMLELATKILKR